MGKSFQSVDEFGQGFRMKLDGSSRMKNSYMGSCLTIIMFLVTLLFTYTKVVTLIEKNDVDIMSALMENSVDFTTTFETKDGFFVAAALTEYDSNTEIVEEEPYGELIIEHYGWGYGDGIGSGSRAIDYHWCTDEELGIARGPTTVIYPIVESSMAEVRTYRKKFKCINNDDLVIWGDYNSAKA